MTSALPSSFSGSVVVGVQHLSSLIILKISPLSLSPQGIRINGEKRNKKYKKTFKPKMKTDVPSLSSALLMLST